jgi:multidrug transporter EmrE-like cation transporter
MTLRGLLMVGLAALFTIAANLMLRGGLIKAGGFGVSNQGFFGDILALLKNPIFDIGVVMYGVAALVWFRVISTEQLSSAYPLLVSISFVFITMGAVVFFHETLSWMKILGIVVILAGIVFVARSGG